MDYDKGGTQKDFYTESETEHANCPLCGEDRSSRLHTERGFLGVVRCLFCGLIYVNPRLKYPEKVYWGDAEKYFEEAKLIFHGKAKHHRDPNYFNDWKLIYRYKPSGNLLDIGTNMGFFLRHAKGRNWRLYGVEPSPALSEMARKYFNLDVRNAFLNEANFEDNFFDIVTMTDVFEHIACPAKLLADIRRILKPDGILFVKVPNAFFNLFKFHCANISGRLWKSDIFDSYEHVVHYSQITLQKMLEKTGFKVVKFYIGRPMQTPVWHNYVGQYYQYPSPWCLDYKRQTMRTLLYLLSRLEYSISGGKIGYLAPNIIAIAKKNDL
jgi:SAM-dependent methyltransferase